MKNNTSIFEIALGLTRPWTVKNIYFEQVNMAQELHIHLDFEKGFKFKQADESEGVAYDTVERKWQHLNFFEHKCYIHAGVPLVLDKSGKLSLQQVPWARKGSGFKLLFELISMVLLNGEILMLKATMLMQHSPLRAMSTITRRVLWLGTREEKMGQAVRTSKDLKEEAARRLRTKAQLHLPTTHLPIEPGSNASITCTTR